MELSTIAQAGFEIVKKASLLAKNIQMSLQQENIVEKQDCSPVTVMDFAIQASIALYLQSVFGVEEFKMIAEEDSQFLRKPSSSLYLEKVVYYVNQILSPKTYTSSEIVDALDKCHYEGSTNHDYWVCDNPIDGTKGFISNAQFAIGLAYVQNGEPVIGIVGMPNFPYQQQDPITFNWQSNTPGIGSICVGIKNKNTCIYDLFSSHSRILQLSSQSGYSAVISKQPVNHTTTLQQVLTNLSESQTILEMDSMCKYVVVACGYASIYFRECVNPQYRENVWDHAAGKVVLESAGGIVTDIHGKTLNFSHGAKLVENYGIVASTPEKHSIFIKQLQSVV